MFLIARIGRCGVAKEFEVEAVALPLVVVVLAGVARDGTRGLGVEVGRDGVVRLSRLRGFQSFSISAAAAGTHREPTHNPPISPVNAPLPPATIFLLPGVSCAPLMVLVCISL